MQAISIPDSQDKVRVFAADARTLYFKIDVATDDTRSSGAITYGFVNEPVPREYRSTAIPGVYVLVVDGQLNGIYIQRHFTRITKMDLEGKPTGLNPGGTRVLK